VSVRGVACVALICMDKATTCGSAGVVVRVLRIMERGGKLHGVPGLFVAPSSLAYEAAACVFTISIKGQHTGVRCRGVRRQVLVSTVLTGVPHPHSPPVTSPTHVPHTRRSTTDQLDTRAHTGLTPTGPLGFGATPPECARAQEIADPALITIVGPKTRRVGPTGAHPEEILLHSKS